MIFERIDTNRHKELRKKLVEDIRKEGITDETVLEAMNKVPRHFFINQSQEEIAYDDKAVVMGEDQAMSQPYAVAFQTQLLELSSSDKVLEIGTGSAYQACILAEIAAEVYTIERRKKLFEKYKVLTYLKSYQNIDFFFGDGHNGLPYFAPFDKILITAASPSIPPALLKQLKLGGSLVLPLGAAGQSQMMVKITRDYDGKLVKEAFNNFDFVPLLHGVAK